MVEVYVSLSSWRSRTQEEVRPRMVARCPRIMAPRAPIGWGVERRADGAARPNPCASSPARVNRALPPGHLEGGSPNFACTGFSEVRVGLTTRYTQRRTRAL